MDLLRDRLETIMSMIFLVLFAVCWTATLGADGRLDNSDTNVLKLLDEMNQRMVNMNQRMVNMNQRMVNMENEINELKTQNKEQAELNTELKNQLQDANTGVIAFLAKRAAFTGSDTEPSLIPFDSVDFNIGNAYDPITGTFTPPVNGLYNIGFEALCDSLCGSEGVICIQLQVNGVIQTESCSEHNTHTGTALTFQLTAGDAVGLYMDVQPSCLSLSPYTIYNKFSGHLIYQII